MNECSSITTVLLSFVVHEDVLTHKVCLVESQNVSFKIHTPTYVEDVVNKDDKIVVRKRDVDECVKVSKSDCDNDSLDEYRSPN